MRSSRTGSRTMVAASTAAMFLLLPGLLLAQPQGRHGRGPHGDHGPHGGPMMHRIIERLDLTPAQREAFHDAFAKHREEGSGLKSQVRTARRALNEQIHAETFDEGAIRSAAADLAALDSDLAVMRGMFFNQVSQILTPEQREEAREIHRDMRAFGEEARSHRYDRHPDRSDD